MVNQPNRDLIMATFNLVIDKRELPTRTVPVPIVPVVMTSKEAQDLVSGAAFTGVASGLRADFQRLNSELLSAGITGWNANYGARREHWLPIGSQSGLSLDAEINAAVNQHNAAAALEKPLHAEFYDLPALVAPASRAALRRLRRQGCIVIIDTISIRHPLLLRGLQQSLLDTSAQTAVLTLAPHPNALTLTKSMTFTLELALRESELAARAGDPPYWCDELSAVEQFPRWFLKTLAAVFPSARPEPILSKALPS